MDLTRRIRDIMMKEHLMFAYRGIITNEISIPLLTLLEKEMEHSEFGVIGRKRLFMFVLESLQNVQRHGSGDTFAEMSMVVYYKSAKGYTVTTGNVIQNEAAISLTEKLEQINRLDSKGLKELYRQMLSIAEFSRKGGAGLGLIEMAKTTGNRLDYEFITIDNDYSYFILSKTIDEEGIGINLAEAEKELHGKALTSLERLMAENHLNTLWCGPISSDIGKEVLEFTETKLSGDDLELNIRRRVFSILVELLDNVAKYNPGREAEVKYGMPIAMISLSERVYSVTTGNLILNTQTSILQQKIDIINKHDKKGLREFFVKSLSRQTTETDSTGNMGLIDMARKSGSRLNYKFEEINDLFSYYIITVNITERGY